MYFDINMDLFILFLISLPFLRKMIDAIRSRVFGNEEGLQTGYYVIFLGLYLTRFYNEKFPLDFYQIPIIYVALLVLDHEIRNRRLTRRPKM